MIICLSPEDLLVEARVIAQVYGEKLYRYTSNEKRFSAQQLENENRITFIGHTVKSKYLYGEQMLSPQEFAKQFEARGFPKNKPLIIDLIGCEIGFNGSDRDKPSYMHLAYEELIKLGYHSHNLVINSYTNLAVKETIVEQKVEHKGTLNPGGTSSISLSLVGFTESDQQKYNSDTDVIRLKKDLAHVEDQMTKDATDASLLTKYKDISIQLDELKIKYFRSFATTDDLRKTFDSNANYQVNRHNYKDYTLPPYAQMTIRMLNDRIAELNLEIHETKGSAVLSFFSDVDKKKQKIQLMEKIIPHIRNNPDITYITTLIEGATKDNILFTARTKIALEEIQKELKNYTPLQQTHKQEPRR